FVTLPAKVPPARSFFRRPPRARSYSTAIIWHHQDGAPYFSLSRLATSLCGSDVAFMLLRMTNQPIQPRPVAALTFSSLMEVGGHSPSGLVGFFGFAAAVTAPSQM